jgi:hypothetical protein
LRSAGEILEKRVRLLHEGSIVAEKPPLENCPFSLHRTTAAGGSMAKHLVVSSNHSVHQNPQAIAEVRRMLHGGIS